MCIGCHGIEGYKATFPELYHVPKIAGQNAKYIETALNEYKKGARSHPTMDAVAAACPTRTSPTSPLTTRISNKRGHTMNRTACPRGRNSMAGAAAQAQDLAAGKAVFDKFNCAFRHGADAKTAVDPAHPTLASTPTTWSMR